MGKYVYAVLTVVLIEMALFFFGGTTYGNTTLFGLVTNPSTANLLWAGIYAAMLFLIGTTIVASAFYNVNIYGVYAGIAASLLTFGSSIIHLWQFLYGELTGILSVQFSLMITSMVIAPFLVTYVIATFEWVRSNS